MFKITQDAADQLDSQFVVREINHSGNPQLLIKVPDLAKAAEADVGVEIRREDDNCVVISLLLYDIPTEPVSYEMRFYPDVQGDLRFLHSFIDTAKFRLYPCTNTAGQWEVGKAQLFRVPANVLLRLKHFSLDWPGLPPEGALAEDAPIEDAPVEGQPGGRAAVNGNGQIQLPPMGRASGRQTRTNGGDELAAAPPPKSDPRDMTIQKLKEQNQALRTQLRQKDKRIIELEDKVNEIKSRGRSYRLDGSEKKSWWNPF
jgi:hypothetical protein